MTFEQVRKLLSEQLNVKPEAITMDSDIVADLHADSLDVVEMIMTLETTFDITVSDDDATKLTTVRSIVEYIDSLKK